MYGRWNMTLRRRDEMRLEAAETLSVACSMLYCIGQGKERQNEVTTENEKSDKQKHERKKSWPNIYRGCHHKRPKKIKERMARCLGVWRHNDLRSSTLADVDDDQNCSRNWRIKSIEKSDYVHAQHFLVSPVRDFVRSKFSNIKSLHKQLHLP